MTRLRPGDEVLGWCEGAFAEYVCADESHFVSKPAGLSFEAGRRPCPWPAARRSRACATWARRSRASGCWSIGAGGGVGHVRRADRQGRSAAEVTGVCSTSKRRPRPLARRRRASSTTRRRTSPRGDQRYDVIFQLAGTASPSACKRALTPKGTLVLSSGEGRFSGIDRVVRALVSSPFVSQQLKVLMTKGDQRGSRDTRSLRRSRQGHAGDRQDLSAGRSPRGDRVRGGTAMPRGKVVITV